MINYVLTKDCTGYSYLISPPIQPSNRGLFILKNYIDASIFKAYNINIQISKVIIMRRKTNEQFRKEVFDLVSDEYTFLDSYVNNSNKLRVKHNTCGNIYEVTPGNFLNRGSRCPFCAGLAKKTNNDFKKEIFNLVGSEYTFLDPYVNTDTKLRVKHNKCGYIYKVIPANFLKGTRCPFCSGNIKKTNAQFKQEVKNLVGNEYIFLDSYVNTHTKLRVKHSECGHIYEVEPSNFFRGTRCPFCSANFNFKKNDAEFKQQVQDLVGNEYVFLDAYVDDHTKLQVKHIECGNVYKVTPGNFLYGYRCPFCNSPKGEVAINKILKSLGINYEYQKTSTLR